MAGESVSVDVIQDNNVKIDEISHYDRIVFSPGPGLPSETCSLFPVLESYWNKKPILGVCLGMQGIGEYFGGKLYNQLEVKHGVSELISVDISSTLFHGLEEKMEVGLYHSWALEIDNCPELKQTAISDKKVVMALEHKSFPIYGVQFHPESILTPNGKKIIKNFLELK